MISQLETIKNRIKLKQSVCLCAYMLSPEHRLDNDLSKHLY